MLNLLCVLCIVVQMHGAEFGPMNYIPACVFEQGEVGPSFVYMPADTSNQMIDAFLSDRRLNVSDHVKKYVSALQEWSKNTGRYEREILLENVLKSLLCHFDRCCTYGDSYVHLGQDLKCFFAELPKYMSVSNNTRMQMLRWQICCGEYRGVVIGDRDKALPANLTVTLKDFVVSLYDCYQVIVENMLQCEKKLKCPLSSEDLSLHYFDVQQSLCEAECLDAAAEEIFERIMRVHHAF